MGHPPKVQSLLEAIRERLESGRCRYLGHAKERLEERSVTYLEIEQALNNGYHEKRKDVFKEEHRSWNYAVVGKTLDNRKLRVVVSFDKNNMLIVTVVTL